VLVVHLYARFVAGCTLLVVMSGAAVTTAHGLYQNIHLAAAAVDALLILGLAVWARRWGVLAILVVEGATRASGPVLGTAHAVLGAMLFAAVAAICLQTSWQGEPERVRDFGWPSLRFLSRAVAFLVAVQVGFGAGFRHSAVGVLPHLLGALVVALFIVILGAFVTTQFPKHASLRPLAVAFMTITAIQVFLGLTAFLMRLMNMSGMAAFLGISVAHVATGSLVFAVSVMLAMEVGRCVQPRAETQTHEIAADKR
jgi:hypothetical protein